MPARVGRAGEKVMKKLTQSLAASLLLATSLCSLPAFAKAAEDDADARAQRAVAQMSEKEKLSLMQTELLARIPYDQQPKNIAIGVGYTPGVPRLGVPPLVESDASLGVANMGGFIRPKDGATALPSAMAMGSTWNPAIIEQARKMMGI